MFRTARAFLLVLPAAFLLALLAYLIAHPGAATSFVAYPFLAESIGSWVGRRPLVRFVLASAAFFVPPYLVSGLLLFVADAGRLGGGAPVGEGKAGASGERRAAAGEPLDVRRREPSVRGRVRRAPAPGGARRRPRRGVNIAPLLVVLASFGAVGTGLLSAGLAALPRAVARRLGASV